MGIEDKVDFDIINFFNDIESQDFDDRKKTLKILLDKYIHLTKSTFLMDKHDLDSIVSSSKGIFTNQRMPIFLGKNARKVYEGDLPTICIVEATIGHLNKNDCFKKLPKFDYKDREE